MTKTATYTIWTIKGTTVSTKPTDRQRTTVGVAEEVDFTIDSGGGSALAADWYEDGVQKATSKTTFRWKAPDVATPQVKIKAVIDGYSEEKTYKVEKPSGIEYTKLSSADLTNTNTGEVGMEMIMQVKLEPDTVSFYNIYWKEKDSASTETGNCTHAGSHTHGAAVWLYPNFNNVSPGNDTASATEVWLVVDPNGSIGLAAGNALGLPAGTYRPMTPTDGAWVKSTKQFQFNTLWSPDKTAENVIEQITQLHTFEDDGTLQIDKDNAKGNENGAK